jgi:hypothetical protein
MRLGCVGGRRSRFAASTVPQNPPPMMAMVRSGERMKQSVDLRSG